jgi:ribonuclease E
VVTEAVEVAAEPATEKPKRARKAKVVPETAVQEATPVAEPEPAEKPKRSRAKKSEPVAVAVAVEAEPSTDEPKRGWWQRTFGEAGD